MIKHADLVVSLYKTGVFEFGEFQLKSGQISPIYINLRKIISYPHLLKQIAETFWQKMQGLSYQFICGVPYTALPIATCIAVQHNTPMILRRKEKKDYGTKQIIEGDYQTGQSCLIIEDVVTTGSSILETVNELRPAGLIVTDVVAFINRESDNLLLAKQDIRSHFILNLRDILSILMNSELLTEQTLRMVQTLIKKSA